MDVEPVDLGYEVRQGFQLRLAPAPIVFCRPILCQFPSCRELDALRCVRDGFALRPPRCLYALAQFGKFRFRKTHSKRTNSGLVAASLDFLGHDSAPLGLASERRNTQSTQKPHAQFRELRSETFQV